VSNDDLTDKVAVITGSSRGIGASIALKMARDGANIVLNYHSDSSKKYIDDLIEKIKGSVEYYNKPELSKTKNPIYGIKIKLPKK